VGTGLVSLVVPALSVVVGCNSLSLGPGNRSDGPTSPPTARAGDGAGGPAAPGKFSFRVSPYVFLSDFEIPRDLPLFQELARLRDQVYKELLLPPGTATVQVYLFETKERYERYMQARYPDLPSRRAFFVAQPRSVGGAEDLLVYTYWGERLRQDLRHELTHALLHSVIKDVPLWLDEGLAEYFELPPQNEGVNPAHVERLCLVLGRDYRPDLARLESLKQVDQMNPAEYREAWAWVHLMLHTRPEARAALLTYLQQLRAKRHPGPLQAQLAKVFPALDDVFQAHLTRLGTTLEARSASATRTARRAEASWR
jgi:hypothetical protein